MIKTNMLKNYPTAMLKAYINPCFSPRLFYSLTLNETTTPAAIRQQAYIMILLDQKLLTIGIGINVPEIPVLIINAIILQIN
jgi:hypothetical protein